MTRDDINPTPRERIILILRIRPATRQTLAGYLNMPVTNVKYHLNCLVRSGLVEKFDKVNLHVHGRPRGLYRVVPGNQKENV